MKKIAIIIGSQSDLPQCRWGLEMLATYKDEVQVVGVYVRSQHRNMEEVKQLLLELLRLKVDAAIVGAGWANHLTGCCDAFYRFTQSTTQIPIIGVAFQDLENEKHTQAAILSITEVPGTQVIYQDNEGAFVGPQGFLRACQFVINGQLPEIKLPASKKTMDLSLEEAVRLSIG